MAARAKDRRTPLLLRLYIAGSGPNSLLAIANLTAICAAHFDGHHDLEIVDLMSAPQRGLVDRIIVTPTLLKLGPAPLQRLIGNLSDTASVLRALGVS